MKLLANTKLKHNGPHKHKFQNIVCSAFQAPHNPDKTLTQKYKNSSIGFF